MRARVAPLTKPLTASGLRVPGDKSISHRALLFAALAEGESRIGGLAPGDDVRSTARCLAQLGVPLMRGDGTPWIPKPRSMDFPEDEEPTFVGPDRPRMGVSSNQDLLTLAGDLFRGIVDLGHLGDAATRDDGGALADFVDPAP